MILNVDAIVTMVINRAFEEAAKELVASLDIQWDELDEQERFIWCGRAASVIGVFNKWNHKKWSDFQTKGQE